MQEQSKRTILFLALTFFLVEPGKLAAQNESTPKVKPPNESRTTPSPQKNIYNHDSGKQQPELASLARQLIKAQKNSEALVLLDQKIKNLESNPSLDIGTGDWMSDPSGHPLAFRTTNKKERLDIVLADFYNLKGMAHFNLKELDKALSSFDRSLAHNPYHLQSIHNKGVALAKLGKFDQALACMNEVIKYNKRSEDSYRTRAEIYRVKKQYDKEQADLEEYHKYKRLNIKEEINLTLLSKLEYVFQKLSKLKVPNSEQQIALAIIDYENLRLSESEARLKKVTSQYPGDASAHVAYAVLLNWLKKPSDTIRECDQALKINQALPVAYFLRAKAKISTNDLKGAINDYTNFLEQNKKDIGLRINAYTNRAACLAKAGRYNEAIDDCNRALSLNPIAGTKAVLLSNRGLCREKLGNKAEAIKDYDLALSLNPNEATASVNRGKLMLSMGEYEQAMVDMQPNRGQQTLSPAKATKTSEINNMVAHYTKLLKLFPDSKESLYNRGLLYLTLNKPLEAAQDLNRVLKLSPKANLTSDYAAAFAALALRLQKQNQEAQNLLSQYKVREREEAMPPELRLFFESNKIKSNIKSMPEDLSLTRKTRLMTILGLNAYAQGDKTLAKEFLYAVKNNGETDTDEYQLALAFCQKL